jgi:hypothetical protein
MKNCCNKIRQIRIHKILSNGQHLNIYFEKHSSCNPICVWTVGLCISKTRKQANEWWNNKKSRLSKQINNKTTGKCGLEGLLKALSFILEFRDSLPKMAELHIEWADIKRKSAYRYLLKHNFFLDEKDEVYFSRNMNYWEKI